MPPDALQHTMTLASEFKEGDRLVGGTNDAHAREEARRALLGTPIAEFDPARFVDDGVSELLARATDNDQRADVRHRTIGEVKQILLGPHGADWASRYAAGLPSEAIAALAKTMTNDDLSTLAGKLFNPLPGSGDRIGAPGHFGSRIQPNSPGDEETEILLSVLEGLAYGCGDVIVGINPATNDVETIIQLEQLLERIVTRLELPTRFCVLSDIVKQTAARAHTRIDVGFQSLAGTSRALRSMVGLDADGVLDLANGFSGLYFETGQGSEVTNGVAMGVDMLTLEARTYGLARAMQHTTGTWTIVNDVAGFIGPEVFRSPAQLLRACLEDAVMAKLHGLTMGLDVCATFHMGIDPATLEALTDEIVTRAAPAYLMAVAGNADPMLGYLTTSFRQHPRLRHATGRRIATPMADRLRGLGVGEDSARTEDVASLYAAYYRAGGDRRTAAELASEAQRELHELADRGWDLGRGHGPGHSAPPDVGRRLDAIYRHARRSLYARVEPAVLETTSPRFASVRTESTNRDDYLNHPSTGERIRGDDQPALRALYPDRRPALQLVLSDGLNANALNENLRHVLPPLRQALAVRGVAVGGVDVVIENGRVRAGYHVGGLVDADAIVHLIGERPGTGLDTLSAYLTYGKDRDGARRWSPNLDHSCTTAVCGIHRAGKRPQTAVAEIVTIVERMLEQRTSGISLAPSR